MGIARNMLDISHREIRAPVIVYNKPADPRQEIASVGRYPKVDQER